MPLQFVTTRLCTDGSEFKVNEAEKEEVITTNHDETTTTTAIVEEEEDHEVFVKAITYQEANDALRKSMQPIDEIKLYRLQDSSNSGSVPSTRVSTAASSHHPHSASSSFPSRGADGSKRRVLIGAEVTRILQSREENRMDAKVIERKVHQVINQDFAKQRLHLDKQLHSLHHLSQKRQDLNHTTNLQSIEKERKAHLAASEQRRLVMTTRPHRFQEFIQTKTDEEQADWALKQTEKKSASTMEDELFSLEEEARKAQQEMEDTDSSEEDEEDDKRPKSKKPSRRVSLKEDDRTAKKVLNKAKGSNLHHVDVVAKLQRNLDSLDQSLYKDLMKRQHNGSLEAVSITTSSTTSSSFMNRRLLKRREGSTLEDLVLLTNSVAESNTESTEKKVQTVKDEDMLRLRRRATQFESSLRTSVVSLNSQPLPSPSREKNDPQRLQTPLKPAPPSSPAPSSSRSPRPPPTSPPPPHSTNIQPLDNKVSRRMAIVEQVLEEVEKIRPKKSHSFDEKKRNKKANSVTLQQDELLGDPFGHHQHRPTPSSLYFVCPVGAVARRDCLMDPNDYVRAMPYRGREREALKQQMKHPHLSKPNEQVIEEFMEKNVHPNLVEEAKEVAQQSHSVRYWQRARHAIDKDMRLVRSVCKKISKKSIEETGRMVQLCRDLTDEKEQSTRELIATLQERDFTRSRHYMERLHQFTELDSHQMELLEKTVTTETGCNDKVEVRQPAFLTQLSPVGNKMNSQKIATSTHPRHKLSKSDAYEDTENSQTAENDLKLLYDYDGYFKQMQRKNEEREAREEKERIFEKDWFLQLLRKMKAIKKSGSYGEIPENLLKLLTALKKIISMRVEMTKEAVWLLVDRTIEADEHRSNLVYSALQSIFDAVGVSCEEVYHELKERQVELAPKLLVNIRKARRARLMRAKYKMLSKTQARERKILRMQARVVSAFMSGVKGREIGLQRSQLQSNTGTASAAPRRTYSIDSDISDTSEASYPAERMGSIAAGSEMDYDEELDQLSEVAEFENENEVDFEQLDLVTWLE